MLLRVPTPQDLADSGLDWADVADDFEIELWPDTQRAIALFVDMQTQWRTGVAGLTGLDYASLPALFAVRAIPQDQQAAVFDDLRVMELETLRLLAKERK